MNRYGKRCVLYPRVSTEMQVDGYSLEGQKNMLTRFADREEMIVVDTYEDAGKSGKSIEGRPAFQKMLRDIEDGLDVDYILVYKLSRFGRNAADILNSLELVQSYGVNLICIEEGIDSSQTSGKLLISVLSAVAEIERENIIEQTMNGRREKARQGGWNGGFAPYGYTLEDNKLMIEETEAVAIRKIFELYTSSEIGLGGIANQLNLQGIRKIPRQNGTLEDWTGHFIKLILDNPVYCGKIAYGRRTKEKVKGTKNDYQMKRNDDYILTEGQHKGIVSEEVWEKAHAKRLRTGVKQPSKIGRDRVHLLSGLLKCPVCGSPMYTNKHAWTNKDGTYKEIYYYVCSRNRMVRGKHCEYKAMLKKTDIEPMVIEAIREIVRNEEYAQAIKKRIGVQIDTKAVDKELEGYQAKLKEVDLNKTRLEREIDSLPADAKYRERKLHDMTLRLDSLYDVIVELEEKIEDARLRRDAIKQQAITLENIYKIMVNFDCVYNIINDEEKRNVVTALIKEIEIYRNDESEYPLKRIGLNFPVFKDGGEVTELLWDKGNTVETADKLDDLNDRGEVNAPALVGAEGMELVCDRYPQTGSGMTQFFDLHLLNDQGGTKTVYIPYHCFGMTYADDVQGKSADELPAILVRHFDANYNFRNEIIGRYEPQGIVFETDSFSPFTVSVGGGQSGGDADGYSDNIGDYDRWGEGSAWNGDPLQYMVIKSLRNMDGRDRLELGVDWRYDKVGSIYNVGITPEVLTQIVNANKPLVIYNERELTLSPATLSDMLQKLNVLNANRGAEDNEALLWFRYEYGNRDGENGQAFAFMITVYLGGTRYRLPDGETYTFSIYFDRNDATSYELYCPADPEDASSELVKQANPLSCVDGHNDDGHSWRQCSFTADHDGMFVIHPKDYQMQQSWPWWGVPTPPWMPSPDATTPDSEVPELQALYDSGFKFPVIGKDIHFVFPEQLKEWTEGCGDGWDYRFTVDESKGRVAIEVNMGSRERWEDAVRNIETGGLDDGVFFRYYFGNSDNQHPMTYGFDWYGDYGGQSLADNTLYRGYHHNNGLRLATVNRQNAHNSVLTLNSQGEDWRIILAMSNSEGTVADAEAKYAFRLEILPCEDISFSLPADNGTAVPAARLHPTVTHQDWMATVPADGSVFLRTVEDKTLNSAGSGQYGLIGQLTVDAPEGYALREWRNNCTGGSGRQFPVPLFWDDQVITLIWQKDNAPDLVEYVRVEPMNYLPGFYSLGDKNAPSRAPSTAEFLSAAEQKTLSNNGITVTYDEKLGYFTTSVDASKLTDLSLLHQCVTLKAPENAVYFKFTGEGGSENPASHDIKDDVNRFTEQFSSPDTDLHPVDPDRPIRMPLMHTEELKLDGKTVYYSESQSYNSLIVQWLDEGKSVIGYTCLYGRNGDISTTVDTDTVDTAPTEAVSVPTLVGADLKLLCDRNPQTEDGKRLFLLFNVTGEGQLGEDGAEIYLPYSYFDLTTEEGMALAAKGVRPLIRHYLNENCTEKESLLGEYTAAGVRIVTRSFSPFLIDANGCTVGDLNGDGAVNTLDMQALYENLSTGRTTEKLADEDDFRLLADCNGDGAVNILDYQKLYQGIKTA